MAANMPLIERADIHKSCKALETIVNVFNDYCQAADALANAQKKLARALKDAIGQKATNELARNALNASANLLDSLVEVDAKFVKAVDKECEGASSELKKWFKKLAKEERNHDEKISTANAKIKQAGQAYEKKAKKKDHDAAQEHTKYVNLLSVIGPEMSQEKYNHSLFVTQRHMAALYSVVSSISRATDAEWVRACDCVRRFAPVIGRIGECRTYLEGGWMPNFPDVVSSADDTDRNARDVEAMRQVHETNRPVDEMGVRVAKAASGSTETDSSAHHSTVPAHVSTAGYASLTSPSATSSYTTLVSSPSAPPSLLSRSRPGTAPPTSYFPSPLEKLNTDSVRSIESLSSFPAPPSHFPLPAMSLLPSSPLARRPNSGGNGDKSGTELGGAMGPKGGHDQPRPTSEVAKAIEVASPPPLTDDSGRSPTRGQSQPTTPLASPIAEEGDSDKADTVKIRPMDPPQSPRRRRRDSVPRTSNELGVQDCKASVGVERTDSVMSSNSVVASMRDKWGRGEVSSSTPQRERDIPRLSSKVSELASRYAPTNDTNFPPLSPRNTGQTSPTAVRARQVSGATSHHEDSSNSSGDRLGATAGPTSAGSTPSEIDIARRRRRIEELEDLERREQAQALRAREREIEMRAKELERERERLRTLGTPSNSDTRVPAVRTHPQHSYSMVDLVPPRSGGGSGEAPARPVSQYGEPLVLTASPSTSSSASNPSSRPDHAPYCGCQACSASQYSKPQTQVQVVPQPQVQKEKPKGWMRRLSMPVVANAFSSSDSKKPYGIGGGIAGGPQAPYLETDSTGGISNVHNGRPRKISFGRR